MTIETIHICWWRTVYDCSRECYHYSKNNKYNRLNHINIAHTYLDMKCPIIIIFFIKPPILEKNKILCIEIQYIQGNHIHGNLGITALPINNTFQPSIMDQPSDRGFVYMYIREGPHFRYEDVKSCLACFLNFIHILALALYSILGCTLK